MPGPYDVLIVGGGVAGLGAATVLGRCRRRVLICDDGHPRNGASRAVHCLLAREGVSPADLLATAAEEVARYPTVERRAGTVTSIARAGDLFAAGTADGYEATARKVLLTTGLEDEVPLIPGIDALYGRGVHHCPYCDGFEYRDRPIAVYGAGDNGANLALMMTQWSRDVALCAGGLAMPSPKMQARLKDHGVAIHAGPIACLEGTEDGALRRIHLSDGETLERAALFFATSCRQRSPLSAALGCARDEKGGVITDAVTEESSVKGVYVAGDASRDVLLVAVAIGEGAKAGVAINRALLRDDGLA